MDFEFDPEKSAGNRVKHGIDFVEAQALWLDEALLEVPARTEDEPRFLAIGRIAGRCWSAVFRPARRADADHFGATVPQRGDQSL